MFTHQCELTDCAADQDLRNAIPRKTSHDRMIQRLKFHAMNAMELGDYLEAVEVLQLIVETSDDWQSRLWLAQAYLRTNKQALCRHQLIYIADACPDSCLRRAAMDTLRALCRTEIA